MPVEGWIADELLYAVDGVAKPKFQMFGEVLAIMIDKITLDLDRYDGPRGPLR